MIGKTRISPKQIFNNLSSKFSENFNILVCHKIHLMETESFEQSKRAFILDDLYQGSITFCWLQRWERADYFKISIQFKEISCTIFWAKDARMRANTSNGSRVRGGNKEQNDFSHFVAEYRHKFTMDSSIEASEKRLVHLVP